MFLSTSSKIISIVDDEIDITNLFRDAICRIDGLLVITFNDSIKALKHFTANQNGYVIVLSDYRMPKLDGLDLLRKVKTLNPKVRTILMSAFDVQGDDLLRKYLIEKIIDEFIQKPVSIFHLREMVGNQLHTYELSERM